jgi:uncharacterized protein (TIGR00251 family)
MSSVSDASPLTRAAGDGVVVAIRVAPRACRSAVEGVTVDGQGKRWLRVSVTEAPADGRANAALIRLLAKRWKLPKSALTIRAGTASRTKTLHVAGNTQAILNRISDEEP